MSELTSVSASSGDLVRVCVDSFEGRLHTEPSNLSENRRRGGARCAGGGSQAPRGGVHVDDVQGHAPTLGQTRKRRRP